MIAITCKYLPLVEVAAATAIDGSPTAATLIVRIVTEYSVYSSKPVNNTLVF